MVNKHILFLLLILLFSLLALFFLWTQPILLSVIFIILSVTTYFKYPFKHEMIFYLVIILGGGLVEIMMVNVTHAWSYALPNFFNIPLFMPFLWGLIGVTLISFYEELKR